MDEKQLIDEKEDVDENIYSGYEPNDIYEFDLKSGTHCLPLSLKLLEKYSYFEECGMWSNSDRTEIQIKEIRHHFMKALQESKYASLFSNDDMWKAKGSSVDGTSFPTIVEYNSEHFKREFLGPETPKSILGIFERFDQRIMKPSAPATVDDKCKYYVQLVDLDILLSPSNFVINEESILRPSDYDNFYDIQFTEKTSDSVNQNWKRKIWNENDGVIAFPALDIQKMFYDLLINMCINVESNSEVWMVIPNGPAFRVIKLCRNETRNSVNCFFYDVALGLKCKFWPSSAVEWKERTRIWPSGQDIRACVEQGVHVVIKSPSGNPDVLAWRISFSVTEEMICRLPLVTYYSLRPWSLVKSFLNILNLDTKPEMITSYHVKTLFMFMMERVPKDIWINGEHLLSIMLSIIDELVGCLATHECPHYFIPSVNLFDSQKLNSFFFPQVAKNIANIRSEMLRDPVTFFFPNE